MSTTHSRTPRLDELLDAAACAGVLGLASQIVDGAPIGILDLDGALVMGDDPGPVAAHRHPIALRRELVGSVVAPEAVPESLLALVAKSLELAMDGAIQAAAHARMDQEMSVGRRIQLALLPQRFPDVDGWSFAAAYEAARDVGGDLYDLFPLRGGTDRIALLVADVTGKGIPAALLMADVRALLHAATDNATSPADALGRVNRILVTERPTSLFVTAALLVVDTATGEVAYASAGHEPLLLIRADGRVEELSAEGALLGAFADVWFEDRTAMLEPGDLVLLYTDGVTDARGPAGTFYGVERLQALAAAHAGADPAVLASAIVDAVRDHRAGAEPFDDLTLLVAARERTGTTT
jgi:sigma-B regulation protein RsbU (phosphoserine phosphatase)